MPQDKRATDKASQVITKHAPHAVTGRQAIHDEARAIGGRIMNVRDEVKPPTSTPPTSTTKAKP